MHACRGKTGDSRPRRRCRCSFFYCAISGAKERAKMVSRNAGTKSSSCESCYWSVLPAGACSLWWGWRFFFSVRRALLTARARHTWCVCGGGGRHGSLVTLLKCFVFFPICRSCFYFAWKYVCVCVRARLFV